MRKVFATALHGVLLLSAFLSTYASAQTIVTTSCPSTLNHTLLRLQDEAPQNLCQYAGKVILVVNTASYCGYTVQYEGLEKLYAKYKDQGLVVLGFSSNDFGQQEPADNKKIAEFCHNTYGVKFPMFAKTAVIGSNSNALYTSLMKAGAQAPKWNFHKILIDRKGHVLASYPSQTTPDDKKMTADIVQALSQK